MKINEMKKLIEKYYTPAKLKKEVDNLIKYADNPVLDIAVFSNISDDIMFADLMIDIWIGEEYHDLTVFSIEMKESEMDFWEFKELAEKALASRKKNLIEKEFYYYTIRSTKDYTM